MSIFDTIKQNRKAERVSFHTPGHGGQPDAAPAINACFDITELRYSDYLLNAKGMILDAERFAADCYHSCRSLMFTTGATTANLCLLHALHKYCDTAIIVGKPHRSIESSIMLWNYQSVRIATENDFGYISEKDIDELQIVANGLSTRFVIIVTTPSYYGIVAPMKRIAEIAKTSGAYLVADEAHGAHFVFSQLLPSSANLYADAVVNSCHKTMPVATGGAILNIHNAALTECIEQSRRLLHSTSPSYVTMTTIDYAVREFATHGEALFASMHSAVREFYADVFHEDIPCTQEFDFSRLVISTNEGYASKLFEYFESCGLYAERYEYDTVMLIITPYNYEYLPDVASAIYDFRAKNKDVIITSFADRLQQK